VKIGINCTANGEEEVSMSTSLATKSVPEVSSGVKAGMVIIFYLLTFLTGGFFLFVGSRLGFAVNLSAGMFYITVTVLFYARTKRTHEPTVN
jgi:hypothetical protein